MILYFIVNIMTYLIVLIVGIHNNTGISQFIVRKSFLFLHKYVIVLRPVSVVVNECCVCSVVIIVIVIHLGLLTMTTRDTLSMMNLH